MKLTSLMAAGAAVIGLASIASTASAAIVCNADGDCWHVHKHYNYTPEFGVTVHPDNWKWGSGDSYRWREHPGRGYWKSGVWIKF